MPLMKGESSQVRLACTASMSGSRSEQAAEHHVDLLAGQVGPEAEVRPRRPEADVRVGVAAENVERERDPRRPSSSRLAEL